MRIEFFTNQLKLIIVLNNKQKIELDRPDRKKVTKQSLVRYLLVLNPTDKDLYWRIAPLFVVTIDHRAALRTISIH